MTLQLTAAVNRSDRTIPLLTGDVEPDGIDLTTLDYLSPERHYRMIRYQDFDICEISMGSYLASRSSPIEFPFTAITAFPHRRFRHSYMVKHAEVDVKDPGDLSGKKIGLRTWQVTAGIWMRGIAAEHYGLDLESVQWYTDDTEDVPLDIPEKFDVRSVPENKNMERMLLRGELDGAMYPARFESLQRSDPNIERIFEDPVQVETDYFHETGIFPLMHTIVIRDSVLESNPWVAVNVQRAFQEALNECLRQLEDPVLALVWARHHLEEERQRLGTLPWEYGMTERNRKSLEKFMDYVVELGIAPRRYDPEDLFVPATLDDEVLDKGYVSMDE